MSLIAELKRRNVFRVGHAYPEDVAALEFCEQTSH